jgi:hypothetical protein
MTQFCVFSIATTSPARFDRPYAPSSDLVILATKARRSALEDMVRRDMDQRNE